MDIRKQIMQRYGKKKKKNITSYIVYFSFLYRALSSDHDLCATLKNQSKHNLIDKKNNFAKI